MKTYNKKAVEKSKELSHLPKNKLFVFSKISSIIAAIVILIGILGLVLTKRVWSIAVIIIGIAALITSSLNIFKSKKKS